MTESVYIVSAVRTPVGAFQGVLKTQSAADLGTVAATAAIERARVTPGDIEEAYLGCVLQANVGQAPARQVVLRAACPDTTEATTVNKVCASGMKAIALATQALRLGDRRVMLVGGMESMSQSPFYLPRNSLTYGEVTAGDAILRDGLSDGLDHKHMGLCAENTARVHGISREEQDAYAIQSYERAAAAWSAGAFRDEVVPVTIRDRRGDTVVDEDEEYKKLRKDKVPTLRPAFAPDGTVTAANASSLNDGASALVLASESAVAQHQLTPLARIIGTPSDSHSDGRRGPCAGRLPHRARARDSPCARARRPHEGADRALRDQRGVLRGGAREHEDPRPGPEQGEHARRRRLAGPPDRQLRLAYRRDARACAAEGRVRRRERVQRTCTTHPRAAAVPRQLS